MVEGFPSASSNTIIKAYHAAFHVLSSPSGVERKSHTFKTLGWFVYPGDDTQLGEWQAIWVRPPLPECRWPTGWHYVFQGIPKPTWVNNTPNKHLYPKIFAPWLWQRSLHMRLGFYKTPRLGDCSLWDGGGLCVCVLGNLFNCHTPGYFDDWEEGWSLERWNELRWFQLFWGGCGPVTPVAVCLVVMVSYGSDSSQSGFRGIYGFLANTWKVPFKKKWIICTMTDFPSIFVRTF